MQDRRVPLTEQGGRRRRPAAMSTVSAMQDGATVGTMTTSSSPNRTIGESDDEGGVESNVLEMMGLSLNELLQLSALSDEGPPAPANSLESLDRHDGPSWGSGSPEAWRFSFSSPVRDQAQPALVTGDRAITMTTSEGTKAQRSSYAASAAPLACVAVLMIAFFVAFAYGLFLFCMAQVPATDGKTVVKRSANDTGTGIV